MPEGFNRISDIFKSEPEFDGLRKMMKQSDVVNDFNQIFPELRKVAVAVKVEKKALCIRVENPAWRSELKFMENKIIEKVNAFYKEERIKYIRFVS